jgi:hypothetical protein
LGVAVATVVALVVAVAFIATTVLGRMRRRRVPVPFPESAAVAEAPPSSSPRATIQAPASAEVPQARRPIPSGRLWIAGPEGLELAPESSQPDPGLGLRAEPGPWARAVGWAALALIILAPSVIYVYNLIDHPAFPVGARVEFVGAGFDEGADGDELSRMMGFVDRILYPPLTPVYQVPVDSTLPLERIANDLRSTAPFMPDPFPLFGGLDADEIQDRSRHLKELIEASERERERERRLRGPSGIVFRRGSATGPVTEGVVVKGSRGVIVADDQGGKEDRAVLVQLLRDPTLGDDPGVVVVARSADLRPTGGGKAGSISP